MIAKLYAGPSDGLDLKVNSVEDIITVIRPTESNDPEDMFLDVYVYNPNWCANKMCPFLHYDYVTTERTVDE